MIDDSTPTFWAGLDIMCMQAVEYTLLALGNHVDIWTITNLLLYSFITTASKSAN
jgi:hypothetical protein